MYSRKSSECASKLCTLSHFDQVLAVGEDCEVDAIYVT